MTRRMLVLSLACGLAMAAYPASSFAQEGPEDEPLYVAVDCMKARTADYESVETDIWLPVHQELVKQGKKVGWSFYSVLYGDRSKCDYYTVNTYRGAAQLNDAPPFAEVFAKVHPDKSWDEVWEKTFASREMPRAELWVLVEGLAPASHQYAIVNQMFAEDGDEYVSLEREVYKPVAQALVDAGHRTGWGVYALQAPFGISVPYNFGTVDLTDSLGPVPWVETVKQAHPDREYAEINQLTEQIRDFIGSEVWVRLASTE